MLVAGSYERFLFGHTVSQDGTTLDRSFAYPAHKGPIKCTAAAPPFIVSGGADDTVHVYNTQTQADLGFLMSPGEGAVSAVAFHTPPAAQLPTHLLSGAADGSVAVWRAGGSWDCLKTMTGHAKEVTSLAVHPSGRLLLSAGRDSMLRLWNLVKGRCQYKTRLEAVAEVLELCPSGTAFAQLSSTKVSLHDLEAEGGTAVSSVDLPRRGMCLQLLSEQEAVVGLEDGTLAVWDVRSGRSAASVARAHAARVRGVARLEGPAAVAPSAGAGPGRLGSASADGVIKVWDLRFVSQKQQQRPTPLAEAATTARLTCLCAVPPARAEPAVPAAPAKDAGAAPARPPKAGKPQPQRQESRPEQGGRAGKRGGKLPQAYLALKQQQLQQQQQREEAAGDGPAGQQQRRGSGDGAVGGRKAKRRGGEPAGGEGLPADREPVDKGAKGKGRKGPGRTPREAAAQEGVSVPEEGVVVFPDVVAQSTGKVGAPRKKHKKGSRERREEAQRLAEQAEDFLV